MKKRLLILFLSVIGSSLIAQQPELFKDINPNGHSSPKNLAACNGKLFFTANDNTNGNELWVSDGTVEGTNMLMDMIPGSGGIVTYQPTCFNNNLYFTVNAGSAGFQFWKSDGTAEGTQVVKDIAAFNFGGNDQEIDHFTEFNGKLYFSSYYNNSGYELWCSDGTTDGTYMIKDIIPGSSGSSPSDFTEYNGKLYFAATDNQHGNELWVTDGTEEGTQIVKDINPGSYDSNPWQFCVYNGKLYFNAKDDLHQEELWVTDGTEGGTQMVKDINPEGDSNPYFLCVFQGKLYFQASDNLHGGELWVSDGTAEGTMILKNINPEIEEGEVANSRPEYLFVYNDKLYFTAYTATQGGELWMSDGTEAGTTIVKDLNPGTSYSRPKDILIYNNRIFFTMMNNLEQTFLAASDGTEAGTQWLMPAEYDNDYSILTDKPAASNGYLYFSARYLPNIGSELYRYATSPTNISEWENSESLFIYPNPSNGLFTVFTENFKDGEMEVYSITGEKILTKNVEREAFTQVNLSSLSSGVYIIRLHNAKKVQVQRCIIR